MSNWINWTLAIYLFVSLVLFVRIRFVAQRAIKSMNEKGYPLAIRSLYPNMIRDAFFWPFYIFWHGLKNVIEDIR
jgi:hypothetical protein